MCKCHWWVLNPASNTLKKHWVMRPVKSKEAVSSINENNHCTFFSFKTRVLMETSNFPGYMVYSFTVSAKCHVLPWMPQKHVHANSIKWMSITEIKAKAELRRIQWNMGVLFSHLTCIAHRSVQRTKSMLRKIEQVCSKERCPSMLFPPPSKPGLYKPILRSKTSSYFTIRRRRSHKP